MATITSFVEEKKVDTSVNGPEVDPNILEYLYVAPINDILADDKLVALILKVGVYKTSLCEALGVEQLTINYKGTNYTFYGGPKNVPSNLEIFKD